MKYFFGVQQFLFEYFRNYREEQSAFASAMTCSVCLRFIIELVALALFIASITQNNFFFNFSEKFTTSAL